MIRRALLSDAKAITKIYQNSWQTTYEKLIDKDFIQNKFNNLDAICEGIKKGIQDGNYVVIDEDGILAFASYGPSRGYDGYGEIYSIYIEKNNQKKGYGSLL